MTLYYSGIGSRRCKDDAPLMAYMTGLARALAARGIVLRSGAAEGPDTAFEQGAPLALRRIYVPNARFGKRPREHIIVPAEVNLVTWLRACTMAERLHPLGRHMPQETRELMGRNVYQVLGDNLRTPSEFVICDAPDPVYDAQGRVKDVDGGTGLAVRLAYEHGIEVFHLSTPGHREALAAKIAQYPLLGAEPSKPSPKLG